MNYEKLKRNLEEKSRRANPQQVAEGMEEMKNVKSKLLEPLRGIMDMSEKVMQPLKKELETLKTPKRKKDDSFNGKRHIISQLSDGRILLTFQSMEDSDAYYEGKKLTLLQRLFKWA